MKNFSHCIPTRFVFGRGVEAEAGERRMAAVADALRPVNELLRNMQALEKREGVREIRRG